jgi:small subunit ribosomal protein S21
MPVVRIKDNEPFERALKRFKRQCEKAGIMSDVRKHQRYEKPSERKKRKVATARRKAILRQRKADMKVQGARRRRH